MPEDPRQDPELALPIKLGPCSNAEYLPRPLGPVEREAIRRTRTAADIHARRLGVDRRHFLRTLGGAALMLGVLSACHDEEQRSRGERSGGRFDVPDEAPTEPDAAAGALGGDEVVFDVQSHYLNLDLAEPGGARIGAVYPQSRCGLADARACFAVEEYLDLLFLRSDTSLAILSALPIVPPANPLEIADMNFARELADRMCGDGRILMHGQAQPTVGPLDGQLDAMRTLVDDYPIAGWKVYTHAPQAGWWLDDHDRGAPPVGQAFLDEVRAVGPPIVSVHKGLSGGSDFASPVDVGPAARRNPDLAFVVYHSGFESNVTEGPYDPGGVPRGVDRLVASLDAAGIGPGGNVYAELGSTWWLLMRDPTQAAHVLGKLLTAVGPDNVLWGTDSIWYGTPQDQIQAFRAFTISEELQDRHGYPALTPEVKAKILGANALALYGIDDPPLDRCEFTRDELAQLRAEIPTPARTFGPRNATEMRTLLAAHGGFV